MIDTHVHLWRLGANDCVWPTAAEAPIHRDYALADLVATLDRAGVDRAVLVQSQESARDTEWLLAVAAGSPRIAGVVGWADLADPAAIRARIGSPGLKGLRPMVQDRAADWYDDPRLDPGLAALADAGLVLDALVRVPHLAALDRLAARHPGLRIVVDHAAKPRDLAEWQAAIAPLVARGNVSVKLSGLWTEVTRDEAAAAIRWLRRAFGATRLLWGSDWPVVTLAGAYDDWLGFVRELIPPDDHAAIFHDNAVACYRIEEAHDG